MELRNIATDRLLKVKRNTDTYEVIMIKENVVIFNSMAEHEHVKFLTNDSIITDTTYLKTHNNNQIHDQLNPDDEAQFHAVALPAIRKIKPNIHSR